MWFSLFYLAEISHFISTPIDDVQKKKKKGTNHCLYKQSSELPRHTKLGQTFATLCNGYL